MYGTSTYSGESESTYILRSSYTGINSIARWHVGTSQDVQYSHRKPQHRAMGASQPPPTWRTEFQHTSTRTIAHSSYSSARSTPYSTVLGGRTFGISNIDTFGVWRVRFLSRILYDTLFGTLGRVFASCYLVQVLVDSLTQKRIRSTMYNTSVTPDIIPDDRLVKVLGRSA
jgi:hypothetical protein